MRAARGVPAAHVGCVVVEVVLDAADGGPVAVRGQGVGQQPVLVDGHPPVLPSPVLVQSASSPPPGADGRGTLFTPHGGPVLPPSRPALSLSLPRPVLNSFCRKVKKEEGVVGGVIKVG